MNHVMDLYLMQHGTAFPKELNADQPLSPVGREAVERSARAMARLGIRPDVLIASDKPRSLQTAEILAETLNFPKRHIHTDRAVKATIPPNETLEFLATFPQAHTVLIAGHLPNLQELAGLIIGAPRASLAFSNAGLTRLAVESLLPPRGRLVFHLTPQLLKGMGE